MKTNNRWSSMIALSVACLSFGCSDDSTGNSASSGDTETETGDGDGDTNTETADGTGDGDGDSATGDGDGDSATGDGDGDTMGDGDGDTMGDGDGDTMGDGDGDTMGDGDGDTMGDGDGDTMGDVCGDGMISGNEVCDDGINDGSYGGCAEDCGALGPYCGDTEINGPETCDDGINDGAYDGCANDCLALGPYCGDAEVNGDEVCDDANDDQADGCIGNCTIPGSCLDIHDYDDQLADGAYAVAPEGYDGDAFAVYCDMVSDGGGYTFLKLSPGGQQNAAEAEVTCATYGMQLWIPRSLDHKNSGWAIANDGNIGPDASANYMRILGIYPSQNGATCSAQPMNSGNQNCGWVASDGEAWYVHEVNNITEPNGDNTVVGSMYYQWQQNGNIQWHNDIGGAGYSSDRLMCDVGDKLP